MSLDDLPDVLTVEKAAKVLRIGRTAAFEGVRRGEIPSVKVGRRVLVPRHRLEAMLGMNGDSQVNDVEESAAA